MTVPVNGEFSLLIVHVKSLIDKLGLLERELYLVDDEGLFYVFLQEFYLHRNQVAHAEETDLAGLLQDIECLCDLFGIVDDVRSVKQKCIKITDFL